MIKNEIFFTPDRPQELLHDGIALVTVQVTLPQTERSGGRFNRYYRLWSKRFEQYCRHELFPQAQAAYCRALENGGPIPQWRAELLCRAVWQTDAIVSIVGDTAVTGTAQPILRRQGDTWDAKRELLLSLRDCFPARAPWRQRLTERATEAIAAQESAGVARYHDNWREELVGVFHPRQFYLCQDGMHYFFPFQSIAPAIEGIPTFCMAYDEVNGPFVPRI